jgi:hypothetical protein
MRIAKGEIHIWNKSNALSEAVYIVNTRFIVQRSLHFDSYSAATETNIKLPLIPCIRENKTFVWWNSEVFNYKNFTNEI